MGKDDKWSASRSEGGERQRTPSGPKSLLITVMEAAEMLGIGRVTAYKLMDKGELRWCKVEGCRRVYKYSVYEYIERQLAKTEEEGAA